MNTKELMNFLHIIEKLKCNTRHSDTSTGRRESVAEHSWRLAVMAYLLSDEIKDVDMNRVIRMCLVHDFGEALHGDVPSFLKSNADDGRETDDATLITEHLPPRLRDDIRDMLDDFLCQQTKEAKIARALDKMEAVIQHNESDISSWIDIEYELNRTYGVKEAQIDETIAALRKQALTETDEKIKEAQKK